MLPTSRLNAELNLSIGQLVNLFEVSDEEAQDLFAQAIADEEVDNHMVSVVKRIHEGTDPKFEFLLNPDLIPRLMNTLNEANRLAVSSLEKFKNRSAVSGEDEKLLDSAIGACNQIKEALREAGE